MLAAGSIYIIDCNYIKPPKKKICLCFCIQTPLFFFINSEPRIPLETQFKLSVQDHRALTHDCFLDLSSAKTFQPQAIANAINRGPVDAALIKNIKEAIAVSITLTEKHKNIALTNL